MPKIRFDVIHIDKDNNDRLLSDLHTTIGGALRSVAKYIYELDHNNGEIIIEAYKDNDTEGICEEKYKITKIL